MGRVMVSTHYCVHAFLPNPSLDLRMTSRLGMSSANFSPQSTWCYHPSDNRNSSLDHQNSTHFDFTFSRFFVFFCCLPFKELSITFELTSHMSITVEVPLKHMPYLMTRSRCRPFCFNFPFPTDFTSHQPKRFSFSF